MNKALILIADGEIYDCVKAELANSGFQTEEHIKMRAHCRIVILDYFCLQAGVADDLKPSKEDDSPVFLILRQKQMSFENIRLHGLFRDIWVIPDNEAWGSRTIISALQGKTALQSIFKSYLKFAPAEGCQREFAGQAIRPGA